MERLPLVVLSPMVTPCFFSTSPPVAVPAVVEGVRVRPAETRPLGTCSLTVMLRPVTT